MPGAIVVMPAFNEAAGIAEFLRELDGALAGRDVAVQVHDDASTDGTAAVVDALAVAGSPVVVVPGDRNRGHGPTTVRALRAGLAAGADVVVAVDGDGQVPGDAVAAVLARVLVGDVDVVEGVRTERGDPVFRRLTSAATRALVRRRAGVAPADANTPLRGYRAPVLAELLDEVAADAMTPNLVISTLTRRWGLRLVELPVATVPRRGGPHGSTWGARRRALPTRRFVRFCIRATREWFTMSRGRPVRDEADRATTMET